MQRRDEDSAFDGKAELAALEEIVEHLADPEPVPEPAEQQWATDAAGGNPAGIDVGEDDAALGVPGDRGGEPVEFAMRASTSLRPRALIVRWRTVLPSRTLSTR